MAVILVYDWDYFHYPSVIPNLECAKYAAWRKKKKDIVVFGPNFEPGQYTSVFFRKEYDDGVFDDKILCPNVEYGGRAFSEQYKPFVLEMEHVLPDFEIYKKYKEQYGTVKARREEIRTILNATHVRLSLDGKTLEPFLAAVCIVADHQRVHDVGRAQTARAGVAHSDDAAVGQLRDLAQEYEAVADIQAAGDGGANVFVEIAAENAGDFLNAVAPINASGEAVKVPELTGSGRVLVLLALRE
jgi:hypothetical protein